MKPRLWLALGSLLLLGAAEAPTPPVRLPPAEAAKQGRALVTEILSQQPAQDTTNVGVLRIRGRDGKRLELQLRVIVMATATNWLTAYQAVNTNEDRALFLCVEHTGAEPNRYAQFDRELAGASGFLADTGCDMNSPLAPGETMKPFAGSDFWLADLGLEFFHWPEQRLLKTEMRSGRSCRVLESVNPEPAQGAYSKVISWIDNETSGIVHAEAYDLKGKLLKEFDPKEFRKVAGHWQLEEMQIRNRQTGSRTWIEFNLDRPG
jgi:hypothetical protein